jgi:Fur family transcriptional regulator, ferric uptake regulator
MSKGRGASTAAETLVRKTGDRVTNARVHILNVLLNADAALTHGDVEIRLDKELSVDRVTVYRVLDWLTRVGLAHRITEADRIWRFLAKPNGHATGSAHFTCTCCGETIPLPGKVSSRAPKLPRGYRAQQLEFSVRGLCGDCSRPNHSFSNHARKKTRVH